MIKQMNKLVTRSRKYVASKVLRKKSSASASDESVSRVTTETMAEAREDVLGSARKFIYPLSHSKHKVLTVSTLLIAVVLLVFVGTMSWLLYSKKDTSDFTYKVSQIAPFPIARIGSTFVPYENYLFELKRYIYYYTKVEAVDFSNPTYSPQLDDQKKKVLTRVVDMAYIRMIASEKSISVSDEEVDARINDLKNQNRLGNNDKVFEDTLRDFYNWSVSDFRRSIRNDILTSKVLAELDVDARSRSNSALDELRGGADFGAIAAKYSDDADSKDSAGVIPGYIDPKDRNTSSEQAAILEGLEVGQVSDVVNLGYGLEILKKLEEKDGQYRAAHILILFNSIDEALNDRKAEDKATVYIKL